jgi:hypothetical protein
MRLVGAGFLAASCLTASGAAGHAQDAQLSTAGTIAGPAELVHVEGTRLYVAAERTLRIFDTADASSPRLLGTYTFPEHIRALSVTGPMVYAATDFYGLRIVDAADAAAPVERGSLQMRGGVMTMTTAGAGLVATTNLSDGVQIVDVSNPAAPAQLTSYFTDAYPQGITAHGQLLLVTDASTGLYLIDLATPQSPELIATLPTTLKRLGSSESPAMPSPDVAIAAPKAGASAVSAVVLNKVTGLVEIYDIGDPRRAAKIGSLQLTGRSQCFAARGSLAYVGTADGVHLVDVSKPSSPMPAGVFKTAQAPQDIAVGDTHVFVAAGRGGVVIFRPRP